MKLGKYILLAFVLAAVGFVGFIAASDVPVEQKQTRITIPTERFVQ